MKKTWKKGVMVVTASIMLMTSVATSHAQWTQSGGNWYYVQSNGSYATGWLKEGNQWYYLDGNGVMKTGWQQIGGKWYYLSSNGSMKTGWLKEGNQWYYLDRNGVMKTDWQQIEGKWYYFDSNGVMASDTRIDGYYIGADGVWEEKGNKSENDLFYSYLKEKIIPNVGLSYLGHFDAMKNVDFLNIEKFFVDSKYIGLISTYIGDVNYDGIEEMITFYTKQKKGESGGIILYFDLYTIKDGRVTFLKNIGNVHVELIAITDMEQNLKVGIKEYKNHTYLFIDDEEYPAAQSWNSLSYYDLTDINNIFYVSYYYRGYFEDVDYVNYEKTLNNKTEVLCKSEIDFSGSLIFTGKYSSEEETKNAIQKELDSIGLGKDRELNSQKILECTAKTSGEDGHKMCTNLADYTNIRDTLNVK